MIVENADIPPALGQAVDHYHRLLRLDHWRVELRVWDEIPNGAAGLDARADMQMAYFTACINFRRDLLTRDTQYWQETVLHEVLHLAGAWNELAVYQIIGLLITRDATLEKSAVKLWEDGNEQVTEYLTRALYAVLPKPLNTGS